MITDEQIKQLAFDTLLSEGHFSTFARELIALAQRIKPLEFVQDDEGDYVAKTKLGNFCIYTIGSTYAYGDIDYTALPDAIEAANADYQRRVLSCLVHGGV